MHPDAYRQMADIERRHWWFAGRRAIVEQAMSTLDLPQDARILDVGSGTGGNLAMLQSRGRVVGVEMDAEAIALARQRPELTAEIVQGHFPRVDLSPCGPFDLVCFFDVLEHIEDDGEALSRARTILRDGGAVLLTVPCYRWLWSAHDEFLHHKRRYGTGEMVSKAEGAGFEVQRLSHFNAILLPLMAAARLMDRLLSLGKSSGAGMPPRLVNRLLTSVFSSEARWLKRFAIPFGASLIVVLRKPGPQVIAGERRPGP